MLRILKLAFVALAIISIAPSMAADTTHTVKKGETVYGISRAYGITVETLQRYNPSARDGIRVGDVLVLPDDVAKPANADAKPDKSLTPKQRAANDIDRARTYHTVKRGESLYGIAKRYGMDVDQLLALNPGVDSSGYKAGTVLRLTSKTALPAIQTQDARQRAAVAEEVERIRQQTAPVVVSNADRPAEEVTDGVEVDRPVAETVAVEEVVAESSRAPGDKSIALILPLSTKTAPNKTALLVTDFVRGFMLAADSLSHRGEPVKIMVFDTHNSLDSVKAIMELPQVKAATVIIPTDNDEQLEWIGSRARENGSWVFNLFSVKDSTYLTNPYMVQLNIPHDEMYGKAIDNLVNRFNGYTPVFLSSRSSKNDKEEFVNMLREQYKADGVDFIDIEYSGYLSASDLKDLTPDTARYVFIPSSSTRNEFGHFSSALKTFKDETIDNESVRLFGYPEWITFKGDTYDKLSELNATIYTRFYNDPTAYNSRQVASSFHRWYGRNMLDAYPSQGMLGFDAGFFLIKALRDYDGELRNAQRYDGVQSAFALDGDADSGLVNTALYFIYFRNGGFVEKIALW